MFQGLCCSSQCEFLSADTECAAATECGEGARCQGRNPICPLARSLPDNTLCGEESRTCEGGLCSGSICPRHGNVENIVCDSSDSFLSLVRLVSVSAE